MRVAAIMLLFAATALGQNNRAADQVYLPVAAHAGTYATDAWVTNWSSDPVSISVQFIPQNVAPVPVELRDAFKLRPHERKEVNDLLGTLKISSAGQVVFNACRDGADCRGELAPAMANYRIISVESRTYSGGLGQDLPAIPWDKTATDRDTLQISGIRSSGQWRTNIGLVNASEFSSAYFVLRLYDGASVAQRDQQVIRLGPLESRQQNVASLFPKLGEWNRLNRTRAATNAFVTITESGVTPTADAAANGCPNGCPAFVAYGSLIDNASGDPTTLEAQYVPPEEGTVQAYKMAANAPTDPPCAYRPDCVLAMIRVGDAIR